MAHFKEVALTQLQACNHARIQTLWDQNFLFFFPKKSGKACFVGNFGTLVTLRDPVRKHARPCL